jgi:glycosyltransferase involved in cell wall biosynthesis
MNKGPRNKVAFISSFLPRKCGIATFTSDLINSVSSAAAGHFEALVVALKPDSKDTYENPVKFEIRQNVRSDYACAADYINFSHVDLVSIQHEFGLFGGIAGSYLNLLLKRLKAPVVTTLHTVINEPKPAYRQAMIDLCNHSDRIIVMNERGLDMLDQIYGVQGSKVRLIPHGIPDLPFVDSSYYKHKFGLEGRRTVLTFGLLSKNKGIEVMLKALPAIVKVEPSVVYIVLGMTHPNVLKHDGESYRFHLQHMVKDLGIENNVVFYNRFVDNDELHNFLCAADVYVTPYLSLEQLTSGTLSFAVGTGKSVVSTPYWAATELLSEGRGKLVPQGDSGRMAQEIIEILQDDQVFYAMRRKAYDYGRSRTWPEIGKHYWDLFQSMNSLTPAKTQMTAYAPVALTPIELPDPSLDHIARLTDDTGMVQHASFTIPNRFHGYCTIDNAKAVILMAKHYAQYPEAHALRLLDTYLSFILYAQDQQGLVRNLMRYDRSWGKADPMSDAFGFVLWALGTVIATPPSPSYISVAKQSFDRSVQHLRNQSARGNAYSILGMCNYLRQFQGASDIKRHLAWAADSVVHEYDENSCPDWHWFEHKLTSDNGVLPHALFAAHAVLGKEKYLDIAAIACEFLLDKTLRKDHFSFIGCKGGFERGASAAAFDQLPIDAASTVLMLKAAYESTENNQYLTLQRKAFDWFLGANDLHIPLFDSRTKGCYDALVPGGVNTNQGAESTLSFLLSLLNVTDSVAVLDRCQSEEGLPTAVSPSLPVLHPSPTVIEIPRKKERNPEQEMQELT